MMMKSEPHLFRYIALSLGGSLLILVAVFSSAILPRSEACGNIPCQPNGTWTVNYSGCYGPCTCGSNTASDTCYIESGTCNNDPNNRSASFSACYRGGCCCPSGNCAGQPAGGGGGHGGGGLEDFNNTECYDDLECDVGSFCDWSSNTCQEYFPGD
jgi:hypothetical protein